MATVRPLIRYADTGQLEQLRAGNHVAVAQIAVTEGATTPDPGGTAARGVIAWSTTLGANVRWSGTAWNAMASGGGVSDGDKGDVVVSGSGAVWMVENGAISLAKLGASAVNAFAPIAHVTSGGDSGGDVDYAKVSLLQHYNGTNGSTTFTDNSSLAHVFTANGNAQISTAQSKFGGASGIFDGAGDFLSLAAHPSFDFGAGDFCVELQIYPTNASAGTNFSGKLYQAIFGQYQIGVPSNAGFLLYMEDLKVYAQVSIGGSFVGAANLFASSALAVNTWAHIAVVRSGSSFRLYIDGVQAASATNAGAIDVSTRPVRIAADAAGICAFQGHIDELRVTKGAARYTAAFTPPAAPFEDFGGMGHPAATTSLSGFMSAADKVKINALAPMQTATLSVPVAARGHAVVSLSVAGIVPDSNVIAQLLPNADWDADDLADITVTPTPVTGAIEFTLSRGGPIVGNFKVAYQAI